MRYVKTIYLMHGETELEVEIYRRKNSPEIFIKEVIDLETGILLNEKQQLEIEAIISSDLRDLQNAIKNDFESENPDYYENNPIYDRRDDLYEN